MSTTEETSWDQTQVTQWLEEKGWGQFAPTFQKYNLCHERFFHITLAELVQFLPRTMTTYNERRRLLNDIRSLVAAPKQAPILPHISINTNLGVRHYKSPCSSLHSDIMEQHSPSPTFSPKAAFHKFKNSLQKNSASPRMRHESGDERPVIPARVSSTPEKISKIWAHWHSPNTKKQEGHRKADQRIQITADKETWYSLNVTDMRDPVSIKQHILNRMSFHGDIHQYQFFHENGADPNTPMDPQGLMYLCSMADHSANERILIKPVYLYSNYQFAISTPELGRSPTDKKNPFYQYQKSSPPIRPWHRETPKQPIGIQLSDPPSFQTQLWAVTPLTPVDTLDIVFKTDYWGERPPAEVVFEYMEDYFDSQDLDKEVIVSTTTKKRSHTKSIRVVAREASRKYTHLTRQKGISRRKKSTKLWGQRVVQLKKASGHVMVRLPSVSEHIALSHHAVPTDKTIQWIRGKLIGKGSFGRVYLAFNVDTGEVIAVKQVELPKTVSDQMNEQQHEMVEALYQEIMMLRDLDHENIVQYLGYGHDPSESVINIFLDYVSGGSVASRLALHGALDERLTRHFTRQICAGLEYLHSRHILHRDIKAANILLEADGVCKISDFGLSKKNDYAEVYDQNSRMSLRGSIYWMAPEVVKNEPYSAKVDIWSLGCTVLEMLTGQRPWISLNQIAALYNLGKLNSPTIPDTISDGAKDFLKQCFIIDPLQRPTATKLLSHAFLQEDPHFEFKEYVEKGKI
ncbi:kinase-like domain-containing protein [Gilbertella persicaria]|uniref:kinase-like domain-containing protein n=1 Tax=Gilbertella persicaria TaxID=101096 RepID=UPI00221F5AD1|nr:kinase-like domain-containing protein [Gilbertella persicaria]KAI8098224.1 kinase-like domain-containing protein [Gilbertella persicaria]